MILRKHSGFTKILGSINGLEKAPSCHSPSSQDVCYSRTRGRLPRDGRQTSVLVVVLRKRQDNKRMWIAFPGDDWSKHRRARGTWKLIRMWNTLMPHSGGSLWVGAVVVACGDSGRGRVGSRKGWAAVAHSAPVWLQLWEWVHAPLFALICPPLTSSGETTQGLCSRTWYC